MSCYHKPIFGPRQVCGDFEARKAGLESIGCWSPRPSPLTAYPPPSTRAGWSHARPCRWARGYRGARGYSAKGIKAVHWAARSGRPVPVGAVPVASRAGWPLRDSLVRPVLAGWLVALALTICEVFRLRAARLGAGGAGGAGSVETEVKPSAQHAQPTSLKIHGTLIYAVSEEGELKGAWV